MVALGPGETNPLGPCQRYWLAPMALACKFPLSGWQTGVGGIMETVLTGTTFNWAEEVAAQVVVERPNLAVT